MHDARYIALSKEAAKIRSRAFRLAVEEVIDIGFVNANDTVFLEKTKAASDWGWLFDGTIAIELSSREPDQRLNRWFAEQGIAF